MAAPSRQLPLFPLNTVLLPGGSLPLNIFEPRYRAMTREVMATDRRFGVVLIAEGREVGGTAVPHRLGTVAMITRAERHDDGRYTLQTSGEQRFAIQRTWVDVAGYLVGDVTLLPEVDDAEPAALAALLADARAVLSDFVQRLTPDAAALSSEIAGLTDPLHLSGLGANLLREHALRKQALLEIDSTPERLRQVVRLLRREVALLDLLSRRSQASLRNNIISPN